MALMSLSLDLTSLRISCRQTAIYFCSFFLFARMPRIKSVRDFSNIAGMNQRRNGDAVEPQRPTTRDRRGGVWARFNSHLPFTMAKKKAQAQQKAQPKAQSKSQSSPKDVSSRLPKLIKKSGLEVTELERNQIYLIHNFFTPKECEALIQHFDACLTPQPVPAIPKPGEAFRSNDRQSVQDSAFADLLWQVGMSEVCQQTSGVADVSLPRKPVGLNSNIRIYRYRTGQVWIYLVI